MKNCYRCYRNALIGRLKIILKNGFGRAARRTLLCLLSAALITCLSSTPAFADQSFRFEDLDMDITLPTGWSSFVPGQKELSPSFALIDMDTEKLESYCKDFGCTLYAVRDDGSATFTVVTGNAKHKNLAGQNDNNIIKIMQTNYGMKTLASTLEGKSDSVIYSSDRPFYTVSGSVSSEGARTFIDYYATISDYSLILFIARMEDPAVSKEILPVIESVTLPVAEQEGFNWVPIVGVIVFLGTAYAFYRVGPHKRKKNQWFY